MNGLNLSRCWERRAARLPLKGSVDVTGVINEKGTSTGRHFHWQETGGEGHKRSLDMSPGRAHSCVGGAAFVGFSMAGSVVN